MIWDVGTSVFVLRKYWEKKNTKKNVFSKNRNSQQLFMISQIPQNCQTFCLVTKQRPSRSTKHPAEVRCCNCCTALLLCAVIRRRGKLCTAWGHSPTVEIPKIEMHISWPLAFVCGSPFVYEKVVVPMIEDDDDDEGGGAQSNISTVWVHWGHVPAQQADISSKNSKPKFCPETFTMAEDTKAIAVGEKYKFTALQLFL